MIEPGTTPVGPRAFLSRHAPFDTFSAPALDRIERVLEMRFAARGETIFARDSAGRFTLEAALALLVALGEIDAQR